MLTSVDSLINEFGVDAERDSKGQLVSETLGKIHWEQFQKQYIRDVNHHPIGIVIACRVGPEVHYGWSLKNKNDAWDKAKGHRIALGRMIKDREEGIEFLRDEVRPVLETLTKELFNGR